MMASADLRDELNCSICLNIYTDPVTLTCGHNFCLLCIGNVLDTQQESGVYTCPECRAESQDRPALQRNTTLSNITDRFRSPQQMEEDTGIACTYCLHILVPAAKTCLLCEASLCETHLKVHSKSAEHVITEPTTFLENRKCSVHKKALEYYCTFDATCICVYCNVIGDHKGHQVKILNEASENKNNNLRDNLKVLTSQRVGAEERVASLQKHRTDVKEKAVVETERVTAVIREIRKQLQALENQVLGEISNQEEQVSLQVSNLTQQLELKMEQLSKKIAYTEELLNITDPLTVLQEKESLSAGFYAVQMGGEEVLRDLDVDVILSTLHSGLAPIVECVSI
ncbi:E3 ubiquitin/ISG15 ligase TRIM25-like [Pelobates fuscus]|uniref:E3 ubiquitin/ISG15 ligase TRIM25-like n=1 Tax=Pelobates fuscus TaxID=191477 RepID=UPI002FE461F2